MEKKQNIAIVAGVVVLVGIVAASWLLISEKDDSVLNKTGSTNGDTPALKSTSDTTAQTLSSTQSQESGSQGISEAVTAVTPAQDVKTKAEAAKAITELDSLVGSAGTPTE